MTDEQRRIVGQLTINLDEQHRQVIEHGSPTHEALRAACEELAQRSTPLPAESAQEPEPADRQTRADLIQALDSALRHIEHHAYLDALRGRWEAIRDDLTAQELAQ